MDKLEKYKTLCREQGGREIIFETRHTPYLKEEPKNNAARKPEKEGEEAAMCKWCKHAFVVDDKT